MIDFINQTKKMNNIKILWASPRGLNIKQANDIGCDIITVTNLLDKLKLFNKDLRSFSLETVKMFYDDAQSRIQNITKCILFLSLEEGAMLTFSSRLLKEYLVTVYDTFYFQNNLPEHKNLKIIKGDRDIDKLIILSRVMIYLSI